MAIARSHALPFVFFVLPRKLWRGAHGKACKKPQGHPLEVHVRVQSPQVLSIPDHSLCGPSNNSGAPSPRTPVELDDGNMRTDRSERSRGGVLHIRSPASANPPDRRGAGGVGFSTNGCVMGGLRASQMESGQRGMGTGSSRRSTRDTDEDAQRGGGGRGGSLPAQSNEAAPARERDNRLLFGLERSTACQQTSRFARQMSEQAPTCQHQLSNQLEKPSRKRRLVFEDAGGSGTGVADEFLHPQPRQLEERGAEVLGKRKAGVPLRFRD